jgi:hypothetical protein
MEDDRALAHTGRRAGVEQGPDFVGVYHVHTQSVQQPTEAGNQSQADAGAFVQSINRYTVTPGLAGKVPGLNQADDRQLLAQGLALANQVQDQAFHPSTIQRYNNMGHPERANRFLFPRPNQILRDSFHGTHEVR